VGLNLAISSKADTSSVMANCADSSDVRAVIDNHSSKEEFLMLKPTALLWPDPNVIHISTNISLDYLHGFCIKHPKNQFQLGNENRWYPYWCCYKGCL